MRKKVIKFRLSINIFDKSSAFISAWLSLSPFCSIPTSIRCSAHPFLPFPLQIDDWWSEDPQLTACKSFSISIKIFLKTLNIAAIKLELLRAEHIRWKRTFTRISYIFYFDEDDTRMGRIGEHKINIKILLNVNEPMLDLIHNSPIFHISSLFWIKSKTSIKWGMSSLMSFTELKRRKKIKLIGIESIMTFIDIFFLLCSSLKSIGCCSRPAFYLRTFFNCSLKLSHRCWPSS